MAQNTQVSQSVLKGKDLAQSQKKKTGVFLTLGVGDPGIWDIVSKVFVFVWLPYNLKDSRISY